MSSEDRGKEDKDSKDILRPHQFDGIQEYENQLPRWWVGMFYLSILFALIYFIYYEIEEPQNTLYQSYITEHREEIEAKQARTSQVKALSEDELLVLSKQPAVIELGKAQFASKCVSCHLDDGGGSVGPNLTDDYWIHGNRMTDMIKIITEGVPAKGMPTWGALMSVDEIRAAAAYIKTLHGTKPKNPKKPEGDLVQSN